MDSNPPKLVVQDLQKSFDDEFSVSDVDIRVGNNEIVALLGPSGCGKTTILRCIAGVEKPDGGTISIDGDLVVDDGIDEPPENRNIGMVYQNYAIWPHKTVYENVVFPLEHAPHDVPADRYEMRVMEVLELLEISSLSDQLATDLSGGQQQRTGLARALVHDPELLLLDEPLSNLDIELRKQMRYELQRLQNELETSVLYVTHNQEEAFYLADRVVVMNDGAVVERGEPATLYQTPQSPFTRQFIGARNPFDGHISARGSDEPMVETPFLSVPVRETEYVDNGTDADDVVCYLRPTDCTVGTAVANGGDRRVTVAGTVVAEGILGDEYEVTVDLDDADVELTAQSDGYRDLSRGDRAWVSFDPSALQVYDAEDQ